MEEEKEVIWWSDQVGSRAALPAAVAAAAVTAAAVIKTGGESTRGVVGEAPLITSGAVILKCAADGKWADGAAIRPLSYARHDGGDSGGSLWRAWWMGIQREKRNKGLMCERWILKNDEFLICLHMGRQVSAIKKKFFGVNVWLSMRKYHCQEFFWNYFCYFSF